LKRPKVIKLTNPAFGLCRWDLTQLLLLLLQEALPQLPNAGEFLSEAEEEEEEEKRRRKKPNPKPKEGRYTAEAVAGLSAKCLKNLDVVCGRARGERENESSH